MSFKRSKAPRKRVAAKKKHAGKMKRIKEKKHAAKPLMKTDSNGKWFYVESGLYVDSMNT